MSVQPDALPASPRTAAADRSRTDAYVAPVLARVPWLLSQLDREPHSATSGSFDREHWGWKFRDFPIGVLQAAAYPLALLWRHPVAGSPYHRNPRLLGWIDAAIVRTIGRQQRNGAFDAFCPNEQDPGTTLWLVHALSETFRLVKDALPPERQTELRRTIRRACEFAWPRDETHGFISNHQALFAVAYLDAFELLGEDRYRDRADAIIGRILEQQSPDGWYLEYDGADPGYESLGIFHLAVYWRRTRSARLLESLRRSIAFLSHCVHPDGSIGGVYGSRHTSLYFPGGFEILAAEIPLAAGIAAFMRPRLARHNVVTPALADAENLPPLAYAYLEAGLATGAPPAVPVPALPCEELTGVHRFPGSGLTVAATPHYYAVVHAGRGGICRIFDRDRGELAYEDAGYLVCAKGERWISQRPASVSAAVESDGNEVASVVRMSRYDQVLPSPVRFILLRVLNLTLFRSPRLGGWIRRRIVRRLITGRRGGPFELERVVRFGEAEIRFRDRLRADRGAGVDTVALPRSMTGVHMGSAKYYHGTDLETTPEVPVAELAAALRRGAEAVKEFTVRFSKGASAELRLGAGETERVTVDAVAER